EPGLIETRLKAAGGSRFAVAIDVRKGQPVLRGEAAPLRQTAGDLGVRARSAGVETILYRDLDRNGQLTGLDLQGAAVLLPLGVNVIVAGGGASLADLQAAHRSRLD